VIGGTDITISVAPTSPLLEFVRRYFRAVWPDSVTDDRYVSEGHLFVYRDREAQEAWDREGGEDRNMDSMVQLVLGADSFTLVVSHLPGARTLAMARELEQNIRANWHLFPPTVEGFARSASIAMAHNTIVSIAPAPEDPER
jgi:hypothetical protein